MPNGIKNIIIAEDDQIIADFYREALGPYEAKIYHVTSGVDLINKIIEIKKTTKVDLVLLDDSMPLKNGREALNLLPVLIKDFEDIKILLISGTTLLDKKVKRYNPNTCYLTKPFDINTFYKCLSCSILRAEDTCPYE